MRKFMFVLLIFLNTSTVLFQIATLFTPSWVYRDHQYFSLTQCTSCTNLKANWTYECLARESCEKSEDSCTSLTNYYNASAIYTYLQILSIFLGLVFIEKLFLMVFSLNFGSLIFFHIFSFLHLACLITSILSWVFISSVKHSNLSSGSIFSFFTGVWGTLSCIFTNYLVIRHKLEETRKISNESFQICGISVRILILFGILFGVFAFAFTLGAFISKQWVSGDGFSGSLSRCKDCYEVEWMNWSCLKGFYCEVNENSEECKIYGRLSKSESVLVPIVTIAQFLLLLSFQQSGALLIFQDYGYFYMNYGYIGLALVLNVIATLVYGLTNEVEFNGECNDKICAGKGYVLFIISNFFLVSYFLIISIVRRKIKQHEYLIVVSMDKTVNITTRRESNLADKSLGIPIDDNSIDNQETSRRGSSSQLLKPNTMNPEYIESLEANKNS